MTVAAAMPASLARLRSASRRWGLRRARVARAAPHLAAKVAPPLVDGAAPHLVAKVTSPLVAEAAPHLAAGTGGTGRWRTDQVTVTGTGVAVAVVGCRRTGRRLVLKVPYTAEGAQRLDRQAEVLTALHADPRLDGWRSVAPRHLGHGEAGGLRYWVEEAVPGRPPGAALLRGARDGGVLDTAATLVADLHARTGEQRLLDRATVEAWVEQPLRRIEAYCAGWGWARPGRARLGRARLGRARLLEAAGQVRAELSAALSGRTVRACWIHGDFWPGNLLASGRVTTGVVDWDQAGAGQLPLHDLLHLHIMARRMTTGDELGGVVARALREGVAVAVGVRPERVASWLGGIPPRPAVLLYWLRHVSLFIDSEGHRDNPRWLRGNVERVLCAAAGGAGD
ncbi:MAG TPA: aminoglycoside phosphotransferase family protein [Micromonosporaceae bacterium]|nr:aminoglycoside phosphotransferase family protein [Micromonosporaceae bacterium]